MVICGVVTRMMTNAKKPISAAVTATIAINRDSAQTFQEAQQTLQNQPPPRFGPKSRLGNYCLWDGFDMVNEG